MIQRGIVLFLLSVLTVITQVFAGSLTNDPFVQSSIDRSNFEPGGQYHLFGAPRGGTTDREGRINVLPVYDQQLGSLRLENVVVDGDITYNTRFSGHHWDEHAPFSETSSQSKSTEEGSIADGFTVLKLNWSGTKVHPADGYDGEQGGGYPVPTGARDEYHYTINGNAQRISLQLNDQRSTSQRFLDRFSQAGKDFVDGANQSHDKFFINDPRLNTWGNIAQGFNGLVDAALNPLHSALDLIGVQDAVNRLNTLYGYEMLAGMSGLSADGKGSAIDALAAANGFKNDIVDATHDWALNHPNSVEGAQAAITGIGALVPIIRTGEGTFAFTDKYRTPLASQEAQNVVNALDGTVGNKNKYSSVTVITHEDGTVSVGISMNPEGKGGPTVIQNAQNALDNTYGKDKYTVSDSTLGKDDGLQRGRRPNGELSNAVGQCSEAWCSVQAGKNPSPPTGFATAWRGKGDNGHPLPNPPNNLINHMKPCETCSIPQNQTIYSNTANKGSLKNVK